MIVKNILIDNTLTLTSFSPPPESLLLGYPELQVERNPDLLQHTDFKKLFSDEMSQSRQLEICKLPFLELITITFAIQ